MAPTTTWPDDVRTLAIDIGGSGFKGAILDHEGQMLTERVRMDTPYPVPPEKLVTSLRDLTKDLGSWHRVSVGFPGLVRNGKVRNIPSLSRAAYDGDTDPALEQQWRGFDLAGALSASFEVPVKVANDADVQGCAVVTGQGYEFVITLGTGVGTALFMDGRLLPHIDAGHAPFRKDQTFEEQLGNVVRKEIGNSRWKKRVVKALLAYDRFLFYDTVHIGGGNAKHLDPDELPRKANIVPNTAGITGGVRLWDLDS